MGNNEEEKLNEVKNENIVGPSFDELSTEEMQESQGSGDIQQETTPICVSVAVSALSAAVSGAIVSYQTNNNNCINANVNVNVTK